jgi:hypothetical protein
VIVAQAFFRAASTHDAVLLIEGMFGLRGLGSLPEVLYPAGIAWGDAWRLLVGRHLETLHVLAVLAVAWFLPNATDHGRLLAVPGPRAARRPAALRWAPTLKWLLIMALLLALCLMNLHKEARFLYFQF